MLSSLFSDFDSLCQKYNVYKVHTIGDCYVIMGYTGATSQTPYTNGNTQQDEIHMQAHRVVETGFHMISIIAHVRAQLNISNLNMRIGIHTGSVITGIIGSDIVRYDIFGSDVLTANKMESSGSPGRILISENTKQILEVNYSNIYDFIPNQTVFCQAINQNYETYFLEYKIPPPELSTVI